LIARSSSPAFLSATYDARHTEKRILDENALPLRYPRRMRATCLLLVTTAVLGRLSSGFSAEPPPAQTEEDEYTRYELLDPASAAFRITYEVTAATPGSTVFFNPIRKGSTATDEAVYDRLTGQALPFEIVDSSAARTGGYADAEPDTSYIRIRLARPVPKDGETRLLILKTYRDPKSYYQEGDAIVFSRSLSIRRNSVVLPVGYEIVALNVPSQVLLETDGRLAVSFMNAGPTDMPVVLKARRGRR
jgi:hypothetical protein